MNVYEESVFKDKQLGFFIYLAVEAIMFLTLFVTYLIFTPASEGPHPTELFDVKIVVLSSVFLLSSSGTLYIGERKLRDNRRAGTMVWLLVTCLFGLIFLGFELYEFQRFVSEGYGLSASSFLSSYYVLVGLHAAHVLFGCCWMLVLLLQSLGMKIRFDVWTEKFKIFSYYWHFVDVVWVFILLIVYIRYL